MSFVLLLALMLWTQSYVGTTSIELKEEERATSIAGLRIAAFNVQVFGQSKMKGEEVVANLVKMIRRYDLILIQEIRDSSGTAIVDLLAEVNKKEGSEKYKMVISSRLGRTTSKEQYAFFYRHQFFSAVKDGVYRDQSDHFEREPYMVLFRSPMLAYDFGIIGIHTSPDDAEKEIDYLYDVYEAAKKEWNTDNILLMGDFNGACKYVSDWKKVRLAQSKDVYWLIVDGTDTTTGNTFCAYDRIVSSGQTLTAAIDPFSPKAFNYDSVYKIPEPLALKISDHYPVEMTLRTTQAIATSDVVAFYDIHNKEATKLTKTGFYRIRTNSINKGSYKVSTVYKSTGAIMSIQVRRFETDFDKAKAALSSMQQDFPDALSNFQLAIANDHLERLKITKWLPRNNNYQTLANFYDKRMQTFIITLVCSNNDKVDCWISVGVRES